MGRERKAAWVFGVRGTGSDYRWGLGGLYAYGATLWPFSQLGTASIVIGAVVGALFGAAVRDARR